MKTYLKIKIMCLAAEARIIRHEEGKWPRERDLPMEERAQTRNQERWATRLGLANHRRRIVRKEARASLLAYGYLRGRRYRQIEAKASTPPELFRIRDLVVKYGGLNKVETENSLRDWLKEPEATAIAA
jgi:hypothetical protein